MFHTPVLVVLMSNKNITVSNSPKHLYLKPHKGFVIPVKKNLKRKGRQTLPKNVEDRSKA